MAKTNNDGTQNKAGSGNPPKNLKKVVKPQKEITSRMLIRALNRIREVQHKDGEGGHSLAAIRNYLEEQYRLDMRNKDRQELLKAVMKRQFERGLIGMTNSIGNLNFRKRFSVASDVDEGQSEDEDSMSSDSLNVE